MEPIRVKFHRLQQHQIDVIVDLLKEGENPKICDVCKGELFDHTCPHLGKSIRDVLIESYAILVLDIAKKISTYRKRNDAVSEGMLALTEAVDRLPQDIENAGAWIRTYVTLSMRRFLELDSVIHVPQYKKSHSFLRGSPSIRLEHVEHGDCEATDLIDLLNSIPENDKEETVMQCMIEGGYSLRDMADMCYVTCSRISQIRQNLETRIESALRKLA